MAADRSAAVKVDATPASAVASSVPSHPWARRVVPALLLAVLAVLPLLPVPDPRQDVLRQAATDARALRITLSGIPD